jgi:hypothetical protein
MNWSGSSAEKRLCGSSSDRCLRRKFERRGHRRGEEEQLDFISTKDDWKTVFAFEKK